MPTTTKAPEAADRGLSKAVTKQAVNTTAVKPKPALQSSNNSRNWCQQNNAGPWPLSAISASTSSLPTQTQRVLICIVSSGVSYNNDYLKHNNWYGCSKEHPLDPGGCWLKWDTALDQKGNWKPRATYEAAIMAAKPGVDARIRGVIPDKTDIYVVPVDTDANGAIEPGSAAVGGRSRIRAYSVCEGRLRGLQAADVGLYAPAVRWRMVMLVDVEANSPAAPVGEDGYQISEADWLASATNTTEDGSPPDILVVAPAGDIPGRVTYPAADPRVIAVGGYTCDERPMINYTSSNSSSRSRVPDILAPGKNTPVPDFQKDGVSGVRLWEGSSAAAAYTAAAAARLWSAYPQCPADWIRLALLSSVPGKVLPVLPVKLNLQQAQTYLQQNRCT
eukprot:GHUV01014532.1.p1 GENE.GHUV01014532.1~~GHUV01014532.1.p1  ORF type:complete len:390 (-),score=116.54 GHUV01014532.1:915-2084(-)